MLPLLIVIALLLLFLIIPVGVDAAYAEGKTLVKLKIGFFRFRLFPGDQSEEEKAGGDKKPEKKEAADHPPKEKRKLSKDELFSLFRIGLNTLKKFHRHLSLDLLSLHWTAAASDPYDAVLSYGKINAALSVLLPLLRAAFRIREEDFGTAVDFERTKPEINARMTATLQIWEILYIAFAAGISVLCWLWQRKRKHKIKSDGGKGTE